jgi:aspartyl-tRNA(Asn)/glutamyl-tRNA(Gln) amidotransferase subunit B
VRAASGVLRVRIRRVHLEEDTGKSTHVTPPGEEAGEPGEQPFSLVDLNRSGVPLLEIVTEPDLHSAEDVRAYAMGLRAVLQYLGVNSGDMQKGVLRIEPNISVRPSGSTSLGTRTEVKNLNSFRALERAVQFEIERQISLLEAGQAVAQETVGWDDARQETFSQRGKEEAHDYRYFPEPDLPPLVVEDSWIEAVRSHLPELPEEKYNRFMREYELSAYDADVLITDLAVAEYFEQAVRAGAEPKTAANWLTGDLFSLMNQAGRGIDSVPIAPHNFAQLLALIVSGQINSTSGKKALAEMFATGDSAGTVVDRLGLAQISDVDTLQELIRSVIASNPDQVQAYLDGKVAVANWLFGQIMRATGGRANPQVVRSLLNEQLQTLNS